jgi:hypothetical protein
MSIYRVELQVHPDSSQPFHHKILKAARVMVCPLKLIKASLVQILDVLL